MELSKAPVETGRCEAISNQTRRKLEKLEGSLDDSKLIRAWLRHGIRCRVSVFRSWSIASTA
jgi:hypothetical protein